MTVHFRAVILFLDQFFAVVKSKENFFMIKGKQIYHILLKNEKLIFTVIPKNANTSIKYILLNYINPDALTSVDLKNTDKFHSFTIKHFNFIDHQFCYNNPDHLRICVIRNPFDRLVSGWRDKIRNFDISRRRKRFGFSQACTFEQFINQIYRTKEENIDRHFTPQYRFITYNNEILSDRILRFEDLSNQWNKLVNEIKHVYKIELEDMTINLNNTQGNKSYREYYNKKLRKLVEEKFQKDLNEFNYEF